MKIRDFFKKYAKRYFIDAMSFMALGLFASLLIGTILETIGNIPFLTFLNESLIINNKEYGSITSIMKSAAVYGAAIGFAIAYGLKNDPLVIFSSGVVGAIGSVYGGPVGAYLGSLFGMEVGKLVSKKTPIDIIVTPFVVTIIGGGISYLIGPGINMFMVSLGEFINEAATLQPILMSIIISVIVGMILTCPLSSAAICFMIGINGIAGGAATIGCCVQMVGFAVMSYKDNKWSGVISVGIGTSMLQFSNCLRKPVVWLPTIIASAIIAPFGVCLFNIVNNDSLLSGMGTCGLTGLLGAYNSMVSSNGPLLSIIYILLTCIILPILVTYLIYKLFIKLGWIKDGDLKINML